MNIKKLLAITGISIISIIGICILMIGGYIGFLWISYIDKTIYEGEAYGYKIGSSKEQTFSQIKTETTRYPELAIYINYGAKAGDYKTLDPLAGGYSEIEPYDSWDMLLDGEGEFFNSVRLSFIDGHLISIYRHRKYFELP
jgi:hypothetical protein